MIRISKKVEYGLIALRHMDGHPEELVSAKELSRSYGLSQALIAKVLQVMTQAGILTSEQGAHGGYRLAVNLAKVSYLDLHEAILGPEEGRSSRHALCDLRERCVVLDPVDTLELRVRTLLAETTVAQLFAGNATTIEVTQ